MIPEHLSKMWHQKPYYSMDAYCKNTFGEKLSKNSVDAGMTCPNRDGTLDTRGCIFCSAGGSGEFSTPVSDLFLTQIDTKHKTPRVIVYFQAYTNTYAPVNVLEKLFTTALLAENTAGISIATRPDCLPKDVIGLLDKLRLNFPDKFIWIELGLQTIHATTAAYLRRGYALSCFEEAAQALHSIQIPLIVHTILGLPGETDAMILETILYLNNCCISGIKLQLLYVLENTDLAKDYSAGVIDTLTKEEYIALVIACLEQIRPDIVIHRLTGDGAKHQLIAPKWSMDKRNVLNTLHKTMKLQNTWQGRCYHADRTIDSLQINNPVYVKPCRFPPNSQPDQ